MLKFESKKIPLRKNINPLDVYLFDSVGLIVVKNVLSNDIVEKAKDKLSQKYKQKPWKFPVLDVDSVFWDMMTNPIMLGLVEQFCGEHFRLDHAFGVSSENIVVNLHGGPNCSLGSCFSQVDNGIMVSQLSCGFPLTVQSSETKGMCYIPGSHKSLDSRDGRAVKRELLNDDLNHPSIVVPTLLPGDLVIFSESLIHGDNGWLPKDYHRLIVYYKFAPGHVCWRDPREQERYKNFARNDLERRLIEPPWSGSFSDINQLDKDNKRRGKTLQ